MKKPITWRFAKNFTIILGFLLFLTLFLSNFIWTCYATDMTTQKVLTGRDSLVLNLALLVLASVLLTGLGPLLRKAPEKLLKILRIFIPCHVLFWGAVLIVFSKTVPAADALSVYQCAEAAASGDLSCIAPVGSYLSYYPQQVGLLAFFELLFRLFRLLPISVQYYHLLKILYVLMVCGIICNLLQITDGIFAKAETNCMLLFICCLNAPLLFYGTFLYSEIPSFFAFTYGLKNIMSFLKEGASPKIRHWVGALAGISLAVLLRKNSLILVIAVLIVLFFEGLRRKSRSLALLGILMLALSLGILPCTIKLYELRAGRQLKSGVPSASYFAMGMQESSRAAGWYNGFNFNTYEETGMDREMTVALSKQAISRRLDYFSAHPAYAACFYHEKFLSQWADGTYACRQATLATYGGRHKVFQELYEGKYAGAFIACCNAFQLILFLGGLIFAGKRLFFKKKMTQNEESLTLPVYLLLIGAFGGMLFHMLWEANSRYAFLYFLCLLPYCAEGLSTLSSLHPSSVIKAWQNRKGNATINGKR